MMGYSSKVSQRLDYTGVILEVVPWFGHKLVLVSLKWYYIIHLR